MAKKKSSQEKNTLANKLAATGVNQHFSTFKQPSDEARRRGIEKRRKRAQLKVDLFDEFFNKTLPNDADALEEGVKLIRNAIFANGTQTKLSYKERVKLFMEVAEFVGIKESINFIKNEGDQITGIDFVLVDPRKKPDECREVAKTDETEAVDTIDKNENEIKGEQNEVRTLQ